MKHTYIRNILLPFCLQVFYIDLFSIVKHDRSYMLSWASFRFVTVLRTFCFLFFIFCYLALFVL